jgi:formimidoylglutamate deiminase
MTIIAPELLYRGAAFHSGLALEYDEHTGRITHIVQRSQVEGDVVALPGRALMPGLVNTHSHAFQRLIRGRTQWRPADDSVSDFWTWREAMYRAALTLTPDDVYHVSRFCFLEMLRAGITTVGEFHYLQNDESGHLYANPNELAERVIAAAVDVGIRICLLNTCYATGGIGQPLLPEQRRFATSDIDAYLGATEALADLHVGEPLVSVGIAPHSLRAVPREWVRMLHAWAGTRDLPLHMHVSEQPAEVDACLMEYGVRPVELLAEDLVLDEHFTAIHATHINDREVLQLAESGATVCACPATERDLGDGMVRAADLVRAGCSIALGSDSQTVIDMMEEARLTEYVERLRRLERVILTSHDSDRRHVAPVLLQMMSANGARALRLPAGALEPGCLADFVAVDLDHHALAGWTADTLPALLTLSAPSDVISDVWVGGTEVVTQRVHAAQRDAQRNFHQLAQQFGAAR